MTALSASVIVPTWRDWTALEGCLAALEAQTVPAAAFEILVADNNPEPEMPARVRLPGNARRVWEPAPGSYAARNAAAAAARGAVLFFTDADCRPVPEWIAAGLSELDAHPELARIGGAVLIQPAAEWTVPEVYDRIFNLRQARYVAKGYAATANLIVRRAAFGQVGPFDAGLYSSGDKEWNGRAGRLGLAIAYSARAAVWHPARASFAEHARKRARVAGGRAAMKPRRGPAAWLGLARLLAPAPSPLLRLLREPGLSPGMRARLAAFDYRLRLVEFRTRLDLLRGRRRPARS